MSLEGFDERELEEIRRRKLEELQKRVEEEQRRAIESAQKRIALKQILTPEALSRLDNLRLVNPQLVEALENQLIMLVQSGRIRPPIDDDTLKEILRQIYARSRVEYRFKL